MGMIYVIAGSIVCNRTALPPGNNPDPESAGLTGLRTGLPVGTDKSFPASGVYALEIENIDQSKRQINVSQTSMYVHNKIAKGVRKQVRGLIPALLPKWSIEDANHRCKEIIGTHTAEYHSAPIS